MYVFDLAKRNLTQITSGDYDDQELAWSPDGKQLAFSSNRSTPDPDATYNTDIWTVSADNTDKGAHVTQVTKNPGEDGAPAWSPDGQWIAYTTRLDPAVFEYGTKHLAVIPAGGGDAKVLTQSFDRMIIDPHFSPDGKSIYFIADDDGTQNLCSIPAAGGEITRPVGGRLMVNDYSIGKTGEIAAQVATIDRPDELFTIPAGKLTQITHTNDALFSQLKISHGEYVHFKSKDGTTVAGYLYKPLDYTAGKRVPTILRPHGGPVWAYYAEFAHLAQLLAANGYAVLYPNPRGSTGYGQKYAQAIFADWGNKDFQDDMAMVDYAVAQGIADPDKLGVGGWSYGGISTNFIITQTTRFKAAISGAGEFLYMTNYGHDHYQRDWETGAGPPVGKESAVGKNLAVLSRREHHHSDADHGRQYRLERAYHQWRANVSGAEEPGPHRRISRLPRRVSRVFHAVPYKGPDGTLSGLVQPLRQRRRRSGQAIGAIRNQSRGLAPRADADSMGLVARPDHRSDVLRSGIAGICGLAANARGSDVRITTWPLPAFPETNK